MNSKASSLSPEIESLLSPTPSGVVKLLAAWDGLSTETHISILTRLEKIKYPAYESRRIRTKALEHENPFVRYLAAKDFYFGSQDMSTEMQETLEKIEHDSDPLVKYCLDEKDWWMRPPWSEPKEFFSFPHLRRLAMVRELSGAGEHLASVVEYAIETGLGAKELREIELCEILSDYLQSPKLRDNYGAESFDGFSEYSKGKDVEALWRLVPKCPEAISHVLLEYLPESAGLSSGPSQEILEGLTTRQWNTLLFRDDIRLSDWRKKHLFNLEDQDVFGIKYAAVSRHLRLSHKEFGSIVALSDETRLPLIKVLAQAASDLTLVQYDVIKNLLDGTDYWDERHIAGDRQDRRFRETSKNRERFSDEIHQLRLYRLAHSLASGDRRGIIDELPTLDGTIVEDDAWGTYCNLRKKWPSDGGYQFKTKAARRWLPNINEIDGWGIGDNFWDEEDDEPSGAEIANTVVSRIEGILSQDVEDQVDKLDTITLLVSEIARGSADAQGASVEMVRALTREVQALREERARDSTKTLGYLAFLAAGFGVLALLYWSSLSA